jgi:hypothetical protein
MSISKEMLDYADDLVRLVNDGDKLKEMIECFEERLRVLKIMHAALNPPPPAPVLAVEMGERIKRPKGSTANGTTGKLKNKRGRPRKTEPFVQPEPVEEVEPAEQPEIKPIHRGASLPQVRRDMIAQRLSVIGPQTFDELAVFVKEPHDKSPVSYEERQAMAEMIHSCDWFDHTGNMARLSELGRRHVDGDPRLGTVVDNETKEIIEP